MSNYEAHFTTFVGYTIHYQVLDDHDRSQAKLTNFPGTDLFDLKEAIKLKSELSYPSDKLKLWASKPNEERRDMDKLQDLMDVEGNFDFSTLFKYYRISYHNPISVELPGK